MREELCEVPLEQVRQRFSSVMFLLEMGYLVQVTASGRPYGNLLCSKDELAKFIEEHKVAIRKQDGRSGIQSQDYTYYERTYVS